MRSIKICLIVIMLCKAVLAGSTMESLTVDGNYWFGAAEGFSFMYGTVDHKHNSANLALNAKFSPGFILGADYTYGKLSNPSVEGEELQLPDNLELSHHQQLLGIYVGYPYSVAPQFNVTVSAGLGYYVNREKIWESENPQNQLLVTIKSTKPQLGLAAQYKVTPQFSLRGNFATFMGTGGAITIDESYAPGAASTDSNTTELAVKLFRWQLEGKYLFKPGLEAVAGYRVWDISASDPDDELDSLALDSKGLYIGARYSY